MRRHRMSVLTLTLALALTACFESSTDPEGENGDIAGDWTLVTLDGATLPVVVDTDGGVTTTLTSSTLELSSSDRAKFEGSLTVSNGSSSQNQSYTRNGRYVRDGNTLGFEMEDGDAIGTLNGDQLTVVDDDGTTFVFEK